MELEAARLDEVTEGKHREASEALGSQTHRKHEPRWPGARETPKAQHLGEAGGSGHGGFVIYCRA